MDQTSPEWVVVRCARIERSFLESNFDEAKSVHWSPTIGPTDGFHSHCMICNIAIPWETSPDEQIYSSGTAFLCSFCFERFVKDA
jgi:hypothetical protein